uniref:Uncharacterized protein n=1 Tax=Anguilla anguilla TaxID=7936 RepID=A0A0E9VGH7_ANGAN
MKKMFRGAKFRRIFILLNISHLNFSS